jgi:hypothetical protein
LTNQASVDRTLVALYAPGNVQFRSKLAIILVSTIIAFLTSPALAGDAERSKYSPLESIRHAYARP